MRSFPKKSLLLVLLGIGLSEVLSQAAIYKESGGIVVVEAEHFDKRTVAADDHHWHVVPDDDGKDALGDFGDPPFVSARGGKYIQSLPDSAGGGQNKNSPGDVGTDAYVDYKVQISTPGRYQLYLLWGGYDGSSDSMYAEIVELRDGSGGKANDWYRYARTIANNDFATSWHGVGGPELQDAGGGDVAAAWDIPSAGTYTIRLSQREDGSAVDALALQLATLPAPGVPGPAESAIATSFITITTQPADTAVAVNQTATLSVAATGSSNPTYQWQKAPPGSANFVDVAGATSATFTTAALTPADDGTQYRVKLSITGLTINSRAAKITVDVVSPIAYRAVGSPTFNKVSVVFSEPVSAASAANKANYSIDGGLTISDAVLDAGGSSVTLTTSLQKTGAVYTVTVKDIKDLVNPANTLAPNPTTLKFTGWVLTKGAALMKYWENITPNNIAALTSDPRFPDKPTFTTIEPAFEYPRNGANEAGSNYGNQLTALLSPPTTGDYIFFVCSDDPSELYLSTDENPANKKLIAQETNWSNARQWQTSGGGTDPTSKRSDQFAASEWPTPNVIRLTAGKLYYIEALHTEGGGGDNVGATWMLPGATAEPVDGAPPIPGANLFTYLNPDVSTATIAISGPSDGATFADGATVTLSVKAADPNGPIRKVEYLANGAKIGESTTAPFSITWSGVASGRYSITANALDRLGYTVSSSAVKILVGTPPPLALFLHGTLTGSDNAVIARLKFLGYDVVDVLDTASATSDATGKDLIVISSTVGSGNIGTKFTTTPVGIINWESALYDELGIEDNNVNGRTIAAQTDIEIVDAAHPLAAGLTKGVKTVLTTAGDMTTLDTIVASAKIVATSTEGTPIVFGIEKGAALNPARTATAPARRVGFYLANDTFANSTDDGKKLFDAAVKWAANLPTVVPAPKFNPPTLQGGSITLSWSGTGTLQQTDSIAGPWTDAASQTNPQTVTVTGAARFYRLKQ